MVAQPTRIDPRWALRVGTDQLTLAAAITAGLLAVYSSSAHMAAFPHGTVVLPWRFPILAILTFVGSGVLLALYVYQRPDRYWATLVATAIVTAGMFVLRFPLYDEWLAAAIAFGGLSACLSGRVPVRRRDGFRAGWAALFLGLCIYLIYESLVGIWLYGNLKAVRYTFTFASVLVIGWTHLKFDLPRPSARTVTLLVALSGLAYYLLVFAHGLLFPEYAFELTLEGIGAAGSSHECVAGVVAVPAGVLLIGDELAARRVLGWIVVGAATMLAALADARGGMLCIVVALAVATVALRPRRSLKLWTVASVGAFAFGALVIARKEWIFDILGAMLSATQIESGVVESVYFGEVVAHARGDAGRFYYVRGGVDALLNEGPRVALLGTGTYGYFPVAGKYYEEATRRAGVPTFVINLGSSIGGVSEPPRPPAMGVLIAETGFVGLTLLGSCMVLALSAILLRRRRDGRLKLAIRDNALVASAVALAAVWTYFGDAPDTIFFYLLIMPYGLAHTWSGLDREAATIGPRLRPEGRRSFLGRPAPSRAEPVFPQ